MPSKNKQSEYKQIKHGGVFFDILTGKSSLFVKEHKRWQPVCFVFHALKTQPNSALRVYFEQLDLRWFAIPFSLQDSLFRKRFELEQLQSSPLPHEISQ